jgi:elongation factor Ts
MEEARHALVMKVGENVAIRRCAVLRAQGGLFFYIHHGAQIGALADISGGDEILGRDICMHIAAARPQFLSAADAPPELAAKEREIALAAAKEEGKPDNIAEKIAAGRAAKLIAALALLAQPFVKDDKKTVGEIANAAGAQVRGFALLAVGGAPR